MTVAAVARSGSPGMRNEGMRGWLFEVSGSGEGLRLGRGV